MATITVLLAATLFCAVFVEVTSAHLAALVNSRRAADDDDLCKKACVDAIEAGCSANFECEDNVEAEFESYCQDSCDMLFKPKLNRRQYANNGRRQGFIRFG